jgi:hypothetical protein
MDYEAKDWVLIRMIVLAAECGAEDDPEFEQALDWVYEYYGADAGEMISTIQVDPVRLAYQDAYIERILEACKETKPALWTTITARIRMFRIVWHVKVARAFKAFKTFIDELRSRK